jgi:iron complex transport system substrate-binding protein
MLEITFKDHLRAIAQVVGKEEKAEEVLDRYQQRIAALKAQLQGRLEGKKISAIWYGDGYFGATNPRAMHFQVLKDIGITPSPIFIEEKRPFSHQPFSIELINQYDADILIIRNDDGKPASFFLENPLISQLKAAQAKRLYVVESETWRAYGPFAVNRILDDLSKYLLEAAATFDLATSDLK